MSAWVPRGESAQQSGAPESGPCFLAGDVRTAFLLLILALGISAGPVSAQRRVGQPDRETSIVLAWLYDVKSHEPGVVDAALRDVAAATTGDYNVIARKVRAVLAAEYREVADRNDILRRGMLLHTDVALLLPGEAAKFEWAPNFIRDRSIDPDEQDAAGVVYAVDGELRATGGISGHWRMARWLARHILPRPSEDRFVREWYRAIAALHQRDYGFGFGKPHLREAQRVLPDDGVLEFFAGLLHEGCASPRVQNVPLTQPSLARNLSYPSSHSELREAEHWLRRAVEHGGPAEARVHLGRVLGRLGRHAEASSMLKDALPTVEEPRLEFLCHLFLGSEEAAQGRTDGARESFERATALRPTAQSPLLALADLAWRAGRRGQALEAIRRVQALPARLAERDDPWQNYLRSCAFDADQRLAAVRAMVGVQEVPCP